MYAAINCVVVTLVPKTHGADCMKDLRPIACCTTVYKIISKILTNRLSKVITEVIDISQTAFLPGRVIHDNILMAFELLRGYSRKHIYPRCTIQMDIRKAYDTVEWNALATILKEMNFPGKFVDWTMECVSTASFRYSINGQLTDLLRARRGLRQGDPISPLLFVVVMEYLHRGLANLSTVQQFKFHPRCKKLGITNISFADDIILFARGDTASVCNLMQVFNLFSQATGLYVQPSKFHVYFGGVQQRIKQEIIQLTGFGEGSIPFKYLGVPLASKKLSSQHCQPLIEKITGRIKHWTSHLLSYAGRCQLIKSVIFAISTYWLQVLPLPKQVLQRIDSICRSFLWCGSDIISRKAPIA